MTYIYRDDDERQERDHDEKFAQKLRRAEEEKQRREEKEKRLARDRQAMADMQASLLNDKTQQPTITIEKDGPQDSIVPADGRGPNGEEQEQEQEQEQEDGEAEVVEEGGEGAEKGHKGE